MVKLQGTAPNQVPTNADLGSLAYADHDNVNLTAADLKLKALSKTKSLSADGSTLTAVDVFIYDTSKDSDGGAWRHRTQHTSWYNEPASNTRGSRKEFPAVAVIVAEANKVTIYDGDDPSLPMWMVFNRDTSTPDTSRAWWRNSSVIVASAVTALNGQVCITLNEVTSSSNGLLFLNFPSDNAGRYSDVVTNGGEGLPITETFNNSLISNLPAIVAAVSNDVAMTVLPDAPIDPATGLPVPTIAVATDVGVSVIKDDGTVVSGGENNASWTVRGVFFDADNTLWATEGTVYSGLQRMSVPPFSTVEDIGSPLNTGYGYPFIFPTATNTFGTNRNAPRLLSGSTIYGNQIAANGNGEKLFTGASSGASSVMHNSANVELSSVAYTTSDYATGWMPGDIKMASLADTDDDNLTGSELITNGDMELNDYWGPYNVPSSSGQSTVQVHSGTYSWAFTSDGNYDGIITDSYISLVAGEQYVVNAWVYPVNDTGIGVRLSNNGVGSMDFANASGLTQGAWNEISVTLTADTTTSTGTLGFDTDVLYSTGTWYIDDVSMRLADPDRSVNGNGLGVHGSIIKEPVATGADLVAYSGFSTSNYLEQPYNKDLDFGTGDFCVMGWVKQNTTATAQVMHRADVAGTGGGVVSFWNSASLGLSLDISDDNLATKDTVNEGSTSPTGVWRHAAFVRSGSNILCYINGNLENTTAVSNAAGSLSNSTAVARVGLSIGGSYALNGSLALLRISATAPTADQIAKIYNDEKFLFQENAKATLYGTSDAVTALAYDDKTQLLHVGTSDGRSEFQGLRRINNTETGVTTAISVSDNLVVEQ